MSSHKNMNESFYFRPFSHSWVAIHPNPKGVIQFVGSFFIFGSLPTVFYYSLLRGLYNQKYTIIAYPSSVIPPLRWKSKLVDHWSASIQLLKEEYAIKAELIAYILNYTNRDSLNIYLDHSNYFWLGHSLGCKYISLLEILSNDAQNINDNLQQSGFKNKELKMIESNLKNLEFERKNSNQKINLLLAKNGVNKNVSSKKFIIDQPAIFLAPEIHGTEERNGATKSAIPFFSLFPDGKTTIYLIEKSQNFFGLTALIAFRYDKISKDDVIALRIKLFGRSKNFICQLFEGYDLKIDRLSSLLSHLKPLSSSSKFLTDCIDKIFDELRKRTKVNYVQKEVQCKASENCSSIDFSDA